MQKPFSIADKIPEECLEAKGNICKTEVHFQGYIPNLMSGKDKARRLQLYLFKEMDGPTPIFFVASDSNEQGAPRASLVPSPSSTTPHCTTAIWRHCGVDEIARTELLWADRETALKTAPETQGWAGLFL